MIPEDLAADLLLNFRSHGLRDRHVEILDSSRVRILMSGSNDTRNMQDVTRGVVRTCRECGYEVRDVNWASLQLTFEKRNA